MSVAAAERFIGPTNLDISIPADCIILGVNMDGQVYNMRDPSFGILTNVVIQTAYEYAGTCKVNGSDYLYTCHTITRPVKEGIGLDIAKSITIGQMNEGELRATLKEACDRAINSKYENDPKTIEIGRANEIFARYKMVDLYCQLVVTGIKEPDPPRDRE